MAGYSKLFAGIVTSSIWCEDDKTFRVWIAMLALSDASGHVDGSIPGFARLVGATIPEMEHAIERLTSPDPYSRTPDNDGRRVASERGGWRILNYAAYREKGQSKDGSRADYMREYYKKRKLLNTVKTVELNSSTLDLTAPASAYASASIEESNLGTGTEGGDDIPFAGEVGA